MKISISRPDFYDGDKVVTLTASIKSGDVTRKKDIKFLVRRADRTEEQALAEDIKYIKENIPSIIKSNVAIMSKTVMPCESTVEWSTDNDSFLDDCGIVTRPDFGLPSEDVTITAKVTNGSASEEIEIESTVLSLTEEDELAIVAKKINWELIKGTNIDKSRVTSNLTFPKTVDQIDVSWNSSDPAYIDSEGNVTRPEYTSSDVQVSVIATLSKNGSSRSVTIDGIKVIKKSPSATQRCEEYVRNEEEVLKWVTADGTNANKSLKGVTESFVLPAENDDMLLVWSVVNSLGEPTSTSYFKVEYVDESTYSKAELVRRYKATVTRPQSNNAQTYLKVTATISETQVDDVPVPGGKAEFIHPIVILQSDTGFLEAVILDEASRQRKSEFDSMLRTEAYRSTWSTESHLNIQRSLMALTPEIKEESHKEPENEIQIDEIDE